MNVTRIKEARKACKIVVEIYIAEYVIYKREDMNG
jgi:hypothetical protein